MHRSIDSAVAVWPFRAEPTGRRELAVYDHVEFPGALDDAAGTRRFQLEPSRCPPMSITYGHLMPDREAPVLAALEALAASVERAENGDLSKW